MQLKNKTIVITGGTDGLGYSLAKTFIEKESKVILISRNQEKIDKALQDLGEKAKAFKADVSNWREVEKVAQDIKEVDILINNAGVWIEGSILSNEIAKIDQAIDTNLKGVIYTTKAFLPKLQKETESHVLNVISTSGLKGRNDQAVYCASKFGVSGFTEALKVDLEKTNIKVTGFYPGGMHTGLFEKAGAPKDNADWMNTDKVSKIIAFMLEQDSSMIMDHVILNKRMTQTSN